MISVALWCDGKIMGPNLFLAEAPVSRVIPL